MSDQTDFQPDDLPQFDMALQNALTVAGVEEHHAQMDPLPKAMGEIVATMFARLAHINDVEVDPNVANVVTMAIVLLTQWEEIIDDFRDKNLSDPNAATVLALMRDMPDPTPVLLTGIALVAADTEEKYL